MRRRPCHCDDDDDEEGLNIFGEGGWEEKVVALYFHFPLLKIWGGKRETMSLAFPMPSSSHNDYKAYGASQWGSKQRGGWQNGKFWLASIMKEGFKAEER